MDTIILALAWLFGAAQVALAFGLAPLSLPGALFAAILVAVAAALLARPRPA